MLAFIGISVTSIIICIIYANITKSKLSTKEVIIIVTAISAANFITSTFIPWFEVSTIAFNTIMVIILIIASCRRTKVHELSSVYAVFTTIIVLLSANLSGAIITLVHILTERRVPIGRVSVQNDIVMLTIYLCLTFIIGFAITREYGNYLHEKIHNFDDSLKKKLAQYLLYGAIITLTVFFILIFFRNVATEEAILTLVYAVALSVSFTYLLFATFAFANNTRMEIELRHKEELMQNLQAYTEHVDSVSQELQNFKHDNMNMMLGFDNAIKIKDWDGLYRYYNKYMETFKQSIAVNDAIVKKLKNIHIPELTSILIAKCVQAQQQNVEMWVEVDGSIAIPNNDFVLLDLCRIAGILLDNALEACKGVDRAEVRFLAMDDETGPVFVFENTCNSRPPINELSKKHYSTKGASRGLGLHNAAQIIAKNQRLTLETIIEDSAFIQKLRVFI